MNIILQRYNNLTLRSKLSLSFILLIVMSMTLLGYGYYYKTSEVILGNAADSILGLVKQTNQALDARFSGIEQSAVNMHLDEELFEFFNTIAPQKDGNFTHEDDRRITRILQKYFPTSSDMYSVNLLANNYMFGGNPNFWLPKTDFADTQVYREGLKATEGVRWIPTYNLLEMFYLSEQAVKRKSQYVFTATRSINVSLIRNNMLNHLPPEAERPVLVVNFQEEMLKQAFTESLQTAGSYYYVLTRDGQTISTSDKERRLPEGAKEWIRSHLPDESGTTYVEIDGVKTLLVYDTIRANGWLSAVFVPYPELVKTVPDIFSYTMLITVVVSLISIIIASMIASRITYPLKRLLAGMRKLGEGNFGHQIEVTGKGEIPYLIHKFNDMNGRIKQLIDENYSIRLKKMEADLRALNFQFNPHFLYNTLNIINYMAIENKQDEISEMLVELSEMLAYTAKYQHDEVPFGEDLNYLENYIGIMKKRFVDKFTVHTELDEALYRYSVPKFFLQPFVENALIHGFEDIEEGGEIRITGFIRNGVRQFVIEDNGVGMSREAIGRLMNGQHEKERKDSIGIDNVDKRIKLLYGETYGVVIHSEPGAGTKVTITLPA
ncbi:sensor histidine kinase [Paenibacillus cisolokensis]|uniref:cache domain-containing sensor histidine kinase n=1 Tax=Paenibacillus cisolokensis TaxID=1658519 RepID=UPI003D291F65